MKRILGILCAISAMVGTASAQEVVINPISSALEDTGTGGWEQWFNRWTDGSGLEDATIVESGDPIPTTWPDHIAGYNADWIGRIRDAGEFETLTFDLGGVYDVTGMVLWNSTEDGGKSNRGFENTVLSYSTDGGATFTAGETLTWTQRSADEHAKQTAAPYTYYTAEIQTLGTSSGPGVTHIRMVVDNFDSQPITMAQEIRFTGVPAAEAFYVAATRTDWTDSVAWSDSNPAMAGTQYFAANSNVVLETPATTATFPGAFLALEDSQRLELMVTGADVITIDPLRLDGAELAASVSGSGEAKLDGEIIALGGFTLGTTNATRDLRILSEINSISGVPMQLSAPGQTIYIDNTNNTVAGIWSLNEGVTVEFADGGALGLGSIVVQSNATLRINGDWDGLSSSEYLTVVDSPSGLVDLGTYSWTVNALQVGSSNVLTGFTYDVAQLNAIGANPMFTGTGTIQVGDPYVPPPPATTYYLQANIPAGKWLGDKEVWFDAPSGGNVMPSSQIFPGSTFDVNGFAWRAQNTGGTSVFDGHLLVNETVGSNLYSAYAADQQLVGGMSLSNSVTARPHRTTAAGGSGTHVSDLQTGSLGKFLFRTLINGGNEYFIQRLSMDTVSGPGEIQFGGNQGYDTNGVWSISVTEISTNFTGVINLADGELTLGSDVLLPNATFEIDISMGISAILSNDASFASISYAGTTLSTEGAYTADELNTELGENIFSGLGTVYIGSLPPNDFAAWALEQGLTGDDALPGTDIEPDGMDNLLEYALGGDPEVDDAAVYMPKSAVVGSVVEYTYNRRDDAASRGLDYDVILRQDLVNGSWDNIGQTAETGSGASPDEGFESVTNQIPADVDAKFISLEVTEN